MSQQRILNKVQNRLDRGESLRGLAKKMGFKSPGTLHHWLKTGRMSEQAQRKANKYFEKENR